MEMPSISSTLTSLGGDLLGGYLGAKRAREQAKAQRKALDIAKQTQLEYYNKNLATQQPYLDSGKFGVEQMMEMIKSGEADKEFGRSFSDYYSSPAPTYNQGPAYNPGPAYQEQDFNFQEDPGAKYRQEQAAKAVQASAAAKGMLHSTGTLNQIQKNASDLASQEYNSAFNRFTNKRDFGRQSFENDRSFGRNTYMDDRNFGRNLYQQDVEQANNNRNFGYTRYRNDMADFMTNLQNKYARFSNLAGAGQNAANQVGSYNQRTGENIAGYNIDRGNVNAASTGAQYGAWMGAANNGLNTISQYQQQNANMGPQLWNQFAGSSGGGGQGGGGGGGLMNLASLAMLA